jgi:hypothetical protein
MSSKTVKAEKVVNNNHNAELPQLSLIVQDELGEYIRSTQLLVKAYSYRQCRKGVDYLIAKQKEILKPKPDIKFKAKNIG